MNLIELPVELQANILNYLKLNDLKNTAITCSHMKALVESVALRQMNKLELRNDLPVGSLSRLLDQATHLQSLRFIPVPRIIDYQEAKILSESLSSGVKIQNLLITRKCPCPEMLKSEILVQIHRHSSFWIKALWVTLAALALNSYFRKDQYFTNNFVGFFLICGLCIFSHEKIESDAGPFHKIKDGQDLAQKLRWL